MFPTGSPGVALLVLRGCVAAALAGIAYPMGWQHVVFLGLLILLCIGLFTPVVCAAAIAAVLIDLPRLGSANLAQVGIVLLATAADGFLGPGAYSVDAKLFGRRMLVSTDATQPGSDDPI
jgi:hypothetical protein